MEQDPDTLDTWFSSALWPFSTLGWPKKTEDLDYFFPTDVLVTGYDIIFFWVIRMIFSGYEQMGKAPFHTVLFHGLVRDSQGRKMSKSLGNGIDPLEVIDKYGADALRLTLITGNAPGNDMRFYWERVESSRNFANKVWNASRFIMMNLEGAAITEPSADELQPADKWILSKVNTLAKDVTENMDKYEMGIAVQKVYDFIWDEFCDWYIEITKTRTYNKEQDPVSAKAAASVYAVYHGGDFLHTASQRGDDHAGKMAGVPRRLEFPGRGRDVRALQGSGKRCPQRAYGDGCAAFKKSKDFHRGRRCRTA